MNQTSLRNTEKKEENNSFEKCQSSPKRDETKVCSTTPGTEKQSPQTPG